jgi:hypothetical protein
VGAVSDASVTLPPLFHVRDIEAFDGPILSELRDADGVPYLEKWCTHGDNFVRLLVVRTTHEAVGEYVAGRVSMLDLLTRPNGDAGFIVDYAGGELYSVEPVCVSTLPDSWLPMSTAMHDESLRPDGFQ